MPVGRGKKKNDCVICGSASFRYAGFFFFSSLAFGWRWLLLLLLW